MATAVVTSAMLRTWLVRLAAMKLTLSVRSFQVPATPFTIAWPPSLPSVPTSRATRVTSDANVPELIDHRVDDLRRAQELAGQRPAVDLERHALRQVALGDRADDARHLGRRLHQVGDQRVDRRRSQSAHVALGVRQRRALPDVAGLADDGAEALELVGPACSLRSIASFSASQILPAMPGAIGGHPRRKISAPVVREHLQQPLLIERIGVLDGEWA